MAPDAETEQTTDAAPGSSEARPPVPEDAVGAPEADDAPQEVVAVGRSNLFLYLAVFYVAVNILLPAILAMLLLGALVVVLTAMLVCERQPESFPEWFRTLHKNSRQRLEENPAEIMVLLGVVLVSVLNNSLLSPDGYALQPRLRECLSVLLIIIAFLLNRRRQPYQVSRQPFWGIFKHGQHNSPIKVAADQTASPPHRRGPASDSQVLRADVNRKTWEKRQQQRWENWIAEEIERLDEKRDSDSSTSDRDG